MSEWISVKDRLPNFEQVILFTDGIRVCVGEYNARPELGVYHHLNNINVRSNLFDGVTEETCAFIDDFSPWGCPESEDVTHWMPLPKPPPKEQDV